MLSQISGNSPCPKASAIPNEQVSRKIDEKGQYEQRNPYYPIQSPRWSVGTGNIHTYHMKTGEYHHALPHPIVNVSDEKAIRHHMTDGLNGTVRTIPSGNVEEHQ
jgi:hypothetical protein